MILLIGYAPVALRGGQVTDAIDSCKGVFVGMEIGEIATYEAHGTRLVTLFAVEREDLVTGRRQSLEQAATYVPGGAGDRYSHDRL